MNPVVVLEGVRTPFGKLGGKLHALQPVDLGAAVASACLQRTGLKSDELSETIFGSALLAASTSVVARQINHKAGIPLSVPSLTIDRACCSSMTAIALAATKLRAGEAGFVLAGGVESCSTTPYLMRSMRRGRKVGDFTVEDPLQARNPINQQSIAAVTGRKALEFGVSREEQDDWACRSHELYFSAFDKGHFAEELIAIESGGELVAVDESARRNASRQALAALQPVYGSPTVTPGNAPGLNDGGSAVVVASKDAALGRALAPLGEIVSYAQACGELDTSVFMPGVAILAALEKIGLQPSDLVRIEINEAFAAMPLVSTLHMASGSKAKAERLRAMTNVNGGSVAIGHPMGASGARIVISLLRELRRAGGGYGVAAICGGYGQADAIVVKV